MRKARVAVVGLGALGSNVALELARAQVGELRVLDFDAVETGTIVRWPTGLTAVGYPKVSMIEARVRAEYPFTRIVPAHHQLGASVFTASRSPNELDVVETLLEDVDLVVDATAELGIQQLVAELARERGVHQLFISATEGARGGIVGYFNAVFPGCWMCLQLALSDGTIPIPSADPNGRTQPRGCASPTFTGASYDLLPVVAQGARVAVAAAGGSELGPSAYVLSIPDGVEPPQWTAHEVHAHAMCQRCSSDAAAAA